MTSGKQIIENLYNVYQATHVMEKLVLYNIHELLIRAFDYLFDLYIDLVSYWFIC